MFYINYSHYIFVNIKNAFFFNWTYSLSYNLTPPNSRVLIGKHLIFCSLTSQTCCNSPGKCISVKCKKRQKTGFPIVTKTTSRLWSAKKSYTVSFKIISLCSSFLKSFDTLLTRSLFYLHRSNSHHYHNVKLSKIFSLLY